MSYFLDHRTGVKATVTGRTHLEQFQEGLRLQPQCPGKHHALGQDHTDTLSIV